MTRITRRQFVRASGTLAFLGAAAAPSVLGGPRSRIRGANDDLRIAVIGLRGRGRNHMDEFAKLDGVRVVALCDVDRNVLAEQRKRLAELGHEADAYEDMRRIFDRQDIDAIACATPNHWHALCGIWACQSGKHAYLEKPVSHNVREGRQLVNAARKYDRIVASGTQARSCPAVRDAIAWVQAGNLGAVKLARGLCYKPRTSIGKVKEDQKVPEHIDYDLWIGPAELRPLRRKNLHYDWHWDLNTGNGDLGNQGIHQMDLARWAVGERGLPTGVISAGGRFGYDDDGDSPNTHVVYLQYEKAPVIFEVRGLPRSKEHHPRWGGGEMDEYKGQRIATIVHCEQGWVELGNYGHTRAFSTDGELVKEWKGSNDHFANFVEAVRAGDRSKLNAEIEEGHVSSALCHLGISSHRLGEPVAPGRARAALSEHEGAQEAFGRFAAHLDANGVDLASDKVTLGPWLAIDPATERFVDDGANRTMTRAYREGFVVPEIA